ncbi:uncharacterized protein DNG_06471 [Cephalotrichum gorgonifer]|uniref:DNA/RNA-binding domain-containing protein n=1 Tax=Cephalotrichum gorgonifer TaxID=2041049 RepID=A0AAE8N2J6_9PEZI|nr:uncharacterized protein DNG_06471 [Cephalotrichum gorgonifer]
MAECDAYFPDGKPETKALSWSGPTHTPYVTARETLIRSPSASAPSEDPRKGRGSAPEELRPPSESSSPSTAWAMEKQPDTKPVTPNQLKVEIKEIYSAAVKVEALCTERIAYYNSGNVNANGNGNDGQAGAVPSISDEEWHKLVGLHKATLHEFVDFFLAAQHPAISDSRAFRGICLKYNMLQRLWQRVQDLLDLMRRRLPASKEYMTGFVSLSFSLFTVLYEHASHFAPIWSECLGDVARFGMAVEAGCPEERAVWVGASRTWYLRTVDLDPGVGRLHHHCAILARPEPVGQLFHFTKSLCAAKPFAGARESIATLFEPVFAGQMAGRCRELDVAVAKVHGMVMRDHDDEAFGQAVDYYKSRLGESIAKDRLYCGSIGYCMAVANTASLLSYCSESNPIAQALGVEHEQITPFGFEATAISANRAFDRAIAINLVTLKTMLRHDDTSPLLPYLHVWLAFLYSLSQLPADGVPRRIFTAWPWKLLTLALDSASQAPPCALESGEPEFSLWEKGGLPLPEDYAMRGLVWADRYLPDGWFAGDTRDYDERVVEMEWMRRERGRRLTSQKMPHSPPPTPPPSTTHRAPARNNRAVTVHHSAVQALETPEPLGTFEDFARRKRYREDAAAQAERERKEWRRRGGKS